MRVKGPGWQRPGTTLQHGPPGLASRALSPYSPPSPQYLADMSQVLGLCGEDLLGLCLHTTPHATCAHPGLPALCGQAAGTSPSEPPVLQRERENGSNLAFMFRLPAAGRASASAC